MKICFSLTMPQRGSWNGKWSGQERFFAIIKSFPGKKGEARAREILKKGEYGFLYRWKDGWTAKVTVREVDNAEARKIKARSEGFSAYDWMLDSILEFGEILEAQEAENRRAHAVR